MSIDWTAEHELLHPLQESACSCLCSQCWNSNWGAEIKDPAVKTVRICLCTECDCEGSH